MGSRLKHTGKISRGVQRIKIKMWMVVGRKLKQNINRIFLKQLTSGTDYQEMKLMPSSQQQAKTRGWHIWRTN